jgi:Undecaprenyl-phosphate galactose phosphotransferase WbaP
VEQRSMAAPAEQRSMVAPAVLVPARHEWLRTTVPGRWKVVGQRRLAAGALILLDVLIAILMWKVSALLLWFISGSGPIVGGIAGVLVPSLAVWLGLRALLGLYPGHGLDWVEQLRRHAYAVLATAAIVVIFAASLRMSYLSPRLLVAMALTSLGLLVLPPLLQYCMKSALRKAGLWGKPVVVLGYGEAGANVVRLFRERWELGYDPIAVFDYRLQAAEGSYETVDTRRTLGHAIDVAHNNGVNTAIFAMPHIRREHLAHLADLASLSFRHVVVIPNLGGITNSAVVARDLAGTFGVEIRHNLLRPWPRRLKRILDLCGVAVGGLLISPIMVTIALLIKLDSPGPVFYGHLRVGARGEHFRCWKFRTMRPDAERLLDEYLQNNPLLRAEWEQTQKLRNDPRVTRVGRFLRKTSLDELPQLWNVLRGEMSLTGPRPIVDAEVCKYGEVYKVYKRIRPGISGFWQVSGRSDTDYAERVAMDSYYVRNWSLWLDLFILARTVKIVLLGRGAY